MSVLLNLSSIAIQFNRYNTYNAKFDLRCAHDTYTILSG